MRELFTAPEAEVIIFVEDIVTQSEESQDTDIDVGDM